MISECVFLCRVETEVMCEDVLHFSSEKALRETLTDFENAYLSRSLSRLFDPINLVFTSSNCDPPTPEEVDNIVKTISRSVLLEVQL